jgi:primase-polymerase (primpol)-like protein
MSGRGVVGLVNGGQALPVELRQRDQWLLAAKDQYGFHKVPKSVDLTGRLIDGSSTNPDTWLAYEDACEWAHEFGLGIGYVCSKDDPFACVDLDVKNAYNAPDKPEKWTKAEVLEGYWSFAQKLNSYTERSISGQGLHVWVKGKVGRGAKRDGVEIYSQERFIVCTGDAVLQRPIVDQEIAITRVAAAMHKASGRSSSKLNLEDFDEAQVLDDQEILEHARNAENSDKFNALFFGEWQQYEEYPSQSEADMALMSLLASRSRNNQQCRRLFRSSGLGQRDKADRDDYLDRMLQKIRAGQAEEKAQAAAFKAQWERMKAAGDGDPVEETTPVLTLDQMLEEFVFIRDQSIVAQVSCPSSMARFTDMRNDFAASMSTVKGAKGKPVTAPTIDLWLKDERRLSAETITFDPRHGRFCSSPDGRRALNLYRPRSRTAPEGWAEVAKPFFEHVEYLVSDPIERHRFLDWLAHIDQRPGELPHFGFIMVALRQGVGRNWMAAVLAQVWRGHVALDFDLKQVLDKGFNGRLSRKLLAVTDEINEGKQGDQWQHAEKLKSMVTTTERHINPKYGAERVEHNCCRWLLFSNHISAIPLTDKDRRWFVIRNPDQPMPAEYYRALYAALEQPQFIAAVRQALLARDISVFNPGEKPEMNEAKRDMVEAATSEACEALAELIRSFPADVISAPEFGRLLYGDDLRPGDQRPTHRANDAGLSRWKGAPGTATADARIRVASSAHPVRVIVLRNAERWTRADADAIRQELARAHRPAMVPSSGMPVPGVPGVPVLIKG